MHISRYLAALALAFAGPSTAVTVSFTPPTTYPYISSGDNIFGFFGTIDNSLIGLTVFTLLGGIVNHVENCLALCEASALTYQYASISAGGRCGCTVTNLANLGLTISATSQLNTLCQGDPYETCGGQTSVGIVTNNFLQVYQRRATALTTGSVATPFIPPGDLAYTFAGAFSDASGVGVPLGVGATGTFSTTATTTVESCLSFCEVGGYNYAALENGVSCYCGNTITPGSGTQLATSAITTVCANSAYEYCGGTNVLQVYKVAAAVFPPVAATATTGGAALATRSAASISGCFATTIFFNSPAQETSLEASLSANFRICATTL